MSLLNMFKTETPLFMEVLREYFEKKAMTSKPSTTEKHFFFFNNIERFFKEKKIEHLQIHEIRVLHMIQLRMWIVETVKSCRRNKPCTPDHASRHIEHCQAAFKYALLMEYCDHNPISSIKRERSKPKEVLALNKSEVTKLLTHSFSDKRGLVVDLFLFQCFTGLSYGDLWSYEIVTEHGHLFITGKRSKSDRRYWSAINEYSAEIHQKYEGVFPFITDQCYNRYLKQIAFALNIKKDITTHVGRKTYATLRFDQGAGEDTISLELGNTPKVARESYIVRGPQRIINEMQQMRKSII